LEIKIKSCLALYWSTELPRLFMVCEIAQFGYNSATVGILIYRQLSAPILKSSSTNSCTYDQNHNEPFHFDVIVAFLSWRHRPVYKHRACLVLRTQNTHYTVQ